MARESSGSLQDHSSGDDRDPPFSLLGRQIQTELTFRALAESRVATPMSHRSDNILPKRSSLDQEGCEFVHATSLCNTRCVRLLHLHPGERPSDPVETSITIAVLDDDSVMFHALSYAWGDSEDTAAIFINGNTFKVSKSLFEAFLVLRNTKLVSTWLWVDAICINQLDPKERNDQVAIMGQIYARATTVHIWFGPAAPGSAELFQVMTDSIREGDQFRRRDVVQSPVGSGVETPLLGSPRSWEHALPAIDALCDVTWWQRLWVLQETAAGKLETIVHWGDAKIWLWDLIRALSDIGGTGMMFVPWEDIGDSLTVSTWNKLEDLQEYSHLHQIAASIMQDPPDSLLEFVGRTWRCKTSNQHDRIFALLSFFPSLDFQPNYESRLETVYEEFVVALARQDWTILFTSQNLGLKQARLLPSWVLDFSQPLESDLSLHIPEDFRAGLTGNFSFNYQYPGQISIPVRLCSPVSFCTTEAPKVQGKASRKLTENKQRLLHSIINLWWSLIEEADGGTDVHMFHLLYVVYGGIETQEDMDAVEEVQSWLQREPLQPLSRALKYGQTVLRILDRVESRRVFLTGNGRLGLAPECVRPGDVLAYLEGGRLFLILRRKSPTTLVPAWELVCRCVCNIEFHNALVNGPESQSDRDWLANLPVQELLLV